MIEPPRQSFVGTIFKVDDRILIAVKLLAVERITCTMHCRRVINIGICCDLSSIKFCKNRRRRRTVETIAVIKYSQFHKSRRLKPATKHFRLEDEAGFVKAKAMNIRLAHRDDVDALIEFNHAMAVETEGKRLDRDVLRPGVEAVFSDHNKGFYVVATQNDAIVGGLMVTFEWSDWRGRWFWWIQSVYIKPDARGQRLYSQMYEFVKERARDAGNVCGFRLYVETANVHAQRVYDAVGMKSSHYLMYEESL